MVHLCSSSSPNLSAPPCGIVPIQIEHVNLVACNRSRRFLEKNIKERNYSKINKQIKKGTVIVTDPNGDRISGIVLC
jgi:23S rRNA pseudoU1915 N3-methylase RlmH